MSTPLVRMPEGTPVFLAIPQEVADRLATTCFRGRDKALAGNFSRYDRYRDFILDMEVSVRLTKTVYKAILERPGKDKFNLRSSIELPMYVGWSSTADLSLFQPHELEPFELNSRVTAWRVKDRTIDAPLTKTITFAMCFRRDDHVWRVSFHTIYPGKDVGRLVPLNGARDISERSHQAFFGWDHPGEPIRP